MPQRILITGANRGIGLEMTRQALARGDSVTAACRTPDRADALNALAGGHDGRLAVIAMEAREEDSVRSAAAACGPLDLIVANAGTLNARGGLTDPGHTQDNIAESLMTNVAGVFFTARHFLPRLHDGAESAGNMPPRIAVISSQMGSSTRAGTSAPGWVQTDMGGAEAAITATESAEGLLRRFDMLTMKTSGLFETYQGEPIPF